MSETAELMEKMPNGLPRCSRYAEYRRITKQADSPDVFSEWLRVACTIMLAPPSATPQ